MGSRNSGQNGYYEHHNHGVLTHCMMTRRRMMRLNAKKEKCDFFSLFLSLTLPHFPCNAMHYICDLLQYVLYVTLKWSFQAQTGQARGLREREMSVVMALWHRVKLSQTHKDYDNSSSSSSSSYRRGLVLSAMLFTCRLHNNAVYMVCETREIEICCVFHGISKKKYISRKVD